MSVVAAAEAMAAWARSRDIPVRLPTDFPPVPDIRENPTLDYGRLIKRTPAFVLFPPSIAALAATVAELRAHGLRWVVRGTGHSSGGQPLIAGGVVIDTRHLTRIVAAGGETVTAEAGCWWLHLVEHLAPMGRRPAVLTDNLRSSVGGTLAVGGVGESSHVEGLQIDSVRALTLVTPDGEVRHLGPHDELARLSLGGHGQLGVIAEATLVTRPRPSFLAARVLVFEKLAQLVAATAERRYPFVRARMFWHRASDENPVRAVVGAFSGDVADAPPADFGGAVKASEAKVLDLLDRARRPRTVWPAFGPCAELALPLPAALDVWPRLNRELRQAGLPRAMAGGASVVVLDPGRRLPLGLVPDAAGAALVVALRPGLADETYARNVAAWLRGFSARAVAAGARLYLIGEEPDHPGWFERQYAAVLPAWRVWKRRLDPQGLCHPWWLATDRAE